MSYNLRRIFRLPRVIEDWLHLHYCCECSKDLPEEVGSMFSHETIPDGEGGTITIPSFKALTAMDITQREEST